MRHKNTSRMQQRLAGRHERAAVLIGQAEKSPPDRLTYLRIYGYKALILLNTDSALGMKALDDYIRRYESDFPLESIKDLRTMRESGRIDKKRLEVLIDEQVQWYEKEMELYIYNNVGFYAREKGLTF